MSSFKVVGVVLGSIPLLISALERYNGGLTTIKRWKKYDEERRVMIRGLVMGEMKLRNVCEKLLHGLAPPSDVEAMIQDPTGPLWKGKDIKRKILDRLNDCADMFEETPDGCLPSIEREIKRPRFSLRQSIYMELLSNIRDGVAHLETLTSQGIELEPLR
ncbi:hypothetical protein N3K66_006409 [Trichothecium roseum]|uniref:Uncharacterized protein n=1 Tax=Trichothecium roseum TaxID=47278 RepID=A0ACC0UVD9_9HYPO|nr:hypothetical protein N3K66_006409 [Trichothecium roseum]